MGSLRSCSVVGVCVWMVACGGETADGSGTTSSPDPSPETGDAGEPEPEADEDALEPEEPPADPGPPSQPEPVTVDVPDELPEMMEPTSEPVEVDAGSQPGPEPIDEPEPIGEPEPAPTAASDPVLLFVTSSVSRVVNLRDGSVWAELASPIYPQEGAAPWSPDGSLLVDQRGEEIVFLRRDAQAFVEETSVAQPGSPARWLGDLGVVVAPESGLALVRPDGTSELLTDLGPVGSIAASPDGAHLFFSTVIEGVFTMYHMSFDGSGWSEPRDLSVVGSSPALSQLWSSDGRYFAFGIAGGDASGIHAFDTETGLVTRVTPEGAGYNPLYSFAGDRNLLVVYATIAEPELGVVNLDGDKVWQVIRTGADTTPAEWSPDGTMLLHGFDTTAELVPFGDDGAPGIPISFPGGGYGCHPLWLTGSDFYFSCAGDGVLERATVEGSSLVVETVREGVFPNFTRSPSGRCALNSSVNEIALVSLASGYEETLRLVTNVPVGFTFADDESGVAWSEANAIGWQSFDETCQPGDGGLVAQGEMPQVIALLP